MKFSLRDILQPGIDKVFEILPQEKPSLEKLNQCRIVAHRGAHLTETENTMAAFDLCLDQQIWGIEFDIRWTKDNVPVLLHDAHAGRTFSRPDLRPDQLTWAELHKDIPQIPQLEEVVNKYGKVLHFMIELKTILTETQKQILSDQLKSLTPEKDFHVIALKPQRLLNLDKFPKECLLLVAEWEIDKMSEVAIAEGWGGLTGHYLLLRDGLLKRHKNAGQKLGTGFIASRNALYRELHRDVDWIFTNQPLQIVKYLS